MMKKPQFPGNVKQAQIGRGKSVLGSIGLVCGGSGERGGVLSLGRISFKGHAAALQPGSGRIVLIAGFTGDNQGNLFIVDLRGPIYQTIDS